MNTFIIESILFNSNRIVSNFVRHCEDEEQSLVSDCFDCFRSLASTEFGRDQLLKRGTVPVLTNLTTSENGKMTYPVVNNVSHYYLYDT